MTDRLQRVASPVVLWAVVMIGKRSSWINYTTIRYSRREAINTYLNDWGPEYREEQLGRRNKYWRVAKISLKEVI